MFIPARPEPEDDIDAMYFVIWRGVHESLGPVHPMGVPQSMLSSGAPREPRVEVDSHMIPCTP